MFQNYPESPFDGCTWRHHGRRNWCWYLFCNKEVLTFSTFLLIPDSSSHLNVVNSHYDQQCFLIYIFIQPTRTWYILKYCQTVIEVTSLG